MSVGVLSDARARAQHVQRLFEAAVDLEIEPRAAYLAQACGDDLELRREVEALLASIEQGKTGDFLPPLFAPTEPAAVARTSLVGRRVGNYEIVAPIAEGGMGAVYLGRHRFIDKRAAVKTLHAELSRQGEMVQRFLNEARAANDIRHPGIIEVLDAGVLDDAGTPYIVMEYLEGESLGAHLRAGRPSLSEIVRIGCACADALAAAHARGIIHRDLKPENVFLVRDSAGQGPATVKVLDFGIAKLRADLAGAFAQGAGQGAAAPTHAGAVLGTPQYMSPEQCRDVSTVDHRSDVYSLGVILYQMACGQLPFVSSSGSLGDLLYQHVTVDPVPPRQHAPELPAAFEAVVLRCLAKDPAGRFASMGELEAALRGSDAGTVAGRVAAATATTLPATVPASGVVAARGRWGVRVAIVVAAVFVAGAAVVLVRRSEATREPAAATSASPPPAVAPETAVVPPARAAAPAPAIPAPTLPPTGEKPAPPRSNRRSDIPDILKKNPY